MRTRGRRRENLENLSKEGKEGKREIVREKESCTNNHTHKKTQLLFISLFICSYISR